MSILVFSFQGSEGTAGGCAITNY